MWLNPIHWNLALLAQKGQVVKNIERTKQSAMNWIGRPKFMTKATDYRNTQKEGRKYIMTEKENYNGRT